MTTDLHAKIVQYGLGQVGVKETGNNGGVPLDRYGLKGEDPLPWCARFVRWVVGQAGAKLPGNQYDLASVQHMEDVFREHGWLVTDPQPGDIVFFQRRIGSDSGAGRHVGIVTSFRKTTLQTVEGNTSNKVATRVYPYPAHEIASFGRIPETKES